jgi:hypothetical protein
MYVARTDGGDVEVGQAVYLGTAMFALHRLRESGGAGWRVLAAGALGLMLGVKYSSAYAVAILGAVWLAVRLIDRASWRTIVADGAVIGLVSLVLGAPWYVRNHVVAGSFIYPYTTAQGGTMWGGAKETGGESLLRTFLDASWKDSFVFVGIAALVVPAAARVRWAGLASVATGLWLQARQGLSVVDILNVWRYSSQGWMPLMVAGGLAVADAVPRGGARRILALGALGVALVIGQGYHAVRNARKIPVAFGLTSRDAYLESRVSTYRALREAEASLAPGKKVLLVEERSYYCRAPFLAAADIQTHVDFDRLKTASEVRRFLEDESIGAIVVDRSPAARIWRFRNLERRLGSEWPVPGVRPVETRGEPWVYHVN